MTGRSITVAAAWTLALAALAGCEDRHTDNASAAGSTFPPLANATAGGEDARSIDPDLLTGAPLASLQAVDADGRFRVPLGDLDGPTQITILGGTYADPETGASVTLDGTVQPDGTVMALFRAMVNIEDEGDDVGGVVVSPLSDLAARMAIGMSQATGRPMVASVLRANAAVSDYFGGATPNFVPFGPGKQLWSLTRPLTVTTLDDPTRLGMIVAGLSVGASGLGVDLETYMDILGADAADGAVDGFIHDLDLDAVTRTALTVDLIDDTLAADIESFLASAQNASTATVALAAPLTAQLRAKQGKILAEAPSITSATPAPIPGSRLVTVDGAGFETGARVVLAGQIATQATVTSATQLTMKAPSSYTSGSTDFLTVINPSGLRGSAQVTITLP